jgi:ferric-dicitrate binding protein FerR (iron transport regulator)
VLVSGAVKVSSKDKKETLLSPSEMYTYSNNLHQIQTVDIENHILWKSGIYQYKSEDLGIILKRLVRYYGKEIDCTPHASSLKCSGKLDLKDDLQLVLDGISKTAPIIYECIDEKYLVTNK